MNEKLGLEEYSAFIRENISKIIINRSYIEENEEFFSELFFKMWEEYHESILEPISILKQMRHLEIFLGVALKCQPTLELPEDVI